MLPTIQNMLFGALQSGPLGQSISWDTLLPQILRQGLYYGTVPRETWPLLRHSTS